MSSKGPPFPLLKGCAAMVTSYSGSGDHRLKVSPHTLLSFIIIWYKIKFLGKVRLLKTIL